jgi:hypothetical protein
MANIDNLIIDYKKNETNLLQKSRIINNLLTDVINS